MLFGFNQLPCLLASIFSLLFLLPVPECTFLVRLPRQLTDKLSGLRSPRLTHRSLGKNCQVLKELTLGLPTSGGRGNCPRPGGHAWSGQGTCMSFCSSLGPLRVASVHSCPALRPWAEGLPLEDRGPVLLWARKSPGGGEHPGQEGFWGEAASGMQSGKQRTDPGIWK